MTTLVSVCVWRELPLESLVRARAGTCCVRDEGADSGQERRVSIMSFARANATFLAVNVILQRANSRPWRCNFPATLFGGRTQAVLATKAVGFK